MDTISLVFVPMALLLGVASHRALRRSRVPRSQSLKSPRRLMVVVLPMFCLLVWMALCYGFKLLTWEPFGGDMPGSVVLTDVLLIAGSSLIGVWISAGLSPE